MIRDKADCKLQLDDNTIKSVFNLRYQIRKTFFQGFETEYDFPDGIRVSHAKAMMFLRMEGPSSMSTISEKANLEKGSFTVVANRLLELGYIEKVQDEEDKRVYNLTLTTKGKEFTDEMGLAHFDYIAGMIDNLSEAEQELFHSSMNMVIALAKKCQDN